MLETEIYPMTAMEVRYSLAHGVHARVGGVTSCIRSIACDGWRSRFNGLSLHPAAGRTIRNEGDSRRASSVISHYVLMRSSCEMAHSTSFCVGGYELWTYFSERACTVCTR